MADIAGSDRALRLMLPEPKGIFTTVGEKVCHRRADASLTIGRLKDRKRLRAEQVFEVANRHGEQQRDAVRSNR